MPAPLPRRDFLALSAAALASGISPLHSFAQQTTSARPNFVVILADDLGYGDLSGFGHPTIKTPNLDQLAADGIRFTDCYGAAPVCSPSRAGLLTGRTPNRLGIYDWIPRRSPMHLQAKEITIAEILKQAGYDTCLSGKYHCNGQFSPAQPNPGDQGFDHWFCTQNNAIPSHLNPNNFVRNGKRVGPLQGYSSTLIVDEAIHWLNARPDQQKPFCAFVWFHSPHETIATDPSFSAMYPQAQTPQQAEYFGNVTQMDHEIGRLLKALDEHGQRDNTLVFFASDNGPETLGRYQGSERSYGSPGPLRGMKLNLYEGGIRVPGILRFPKRIKPGQLCSEPIGSVDLLPTFCQLANAEKPRDRYLDGVSITPLFTARPLQRLAPLYWQYNNALGSNKVALRRGDWKLLCGIDPAGNLDNFELYNLREDISEKRNQAAQEPQRLRELREMMQKTFDQVKAEAPVWPEGGK